MTLDGGDLSVPERSGMPMLGLGTWQNTDFEQCASSVKTALEVGYRHVDTAQLYENEAAVGEGIERADVDRSEIFLASKVWTDRLDYDGVLTSTEESLDRLGVDTLDLLYVHWPAGEYDPRETLSAFSELVESGVIDRIGVSNFTPDLLEEAVDVCDHDIFANQVEMHPFLPQTEIRETAATLDVEIVAYSPLARGSIFTDPVLSEIAEAHEVSEAQVSLAWLRAKGVTAIPKATGRDHIVDNLNSVSLGLSADEIERIDAIDRREREVSPAWSPW